MLLSALAGGASPHSSASRWSVETIAFGCWSRIANSERCLTPPSATARPPSLTSRGPSTRKSIGGLRPTVPLPGTRRQPHPSGPGDGLQRHRARANCAACRPGARTALVEPTFLTGPGLAPASDEQQERTSRPLLLAGTSGLGLRSIGPPRCPAGRERGGGVAPRRDRDGSR